MQHERFCGFIETSSRTHNLKSAAHLAGIGSKPLLVAQAPACQGPILVMIASRALARPLLRGTFKERGMALLDDLLKIETRFWTKGPDYYRQHLDGQCWVAFGQLAGALSNEEIASTVKAGPRWSTPDLRVKGLLQPHPSFAVLTYEASAKRSNGKSYAALVSSGYVRRDHSWKLAFHQQTPLETS
jgi:hypothetical protein